MADDQLIVITSEDQREPHYLLFTESINVPLVEDVCPTLLDIPSYEEAERTLALFPETPRKGPWLRLLGSRDDNVVRWNLAFTILSAVSEVEHELRRRHFDRPVNAVVHSMIHDAFRRCCVPFRSTYSLSDYAYSPVQDARQACLAVYDPDETRPLNFTFGKQQHSFFVSAG